MDEAVREMAGKITATGIYWQHWDSGPKAGWIEDEAERFVKGLGGEKVDIVAKSAGTMVCMAIIKLRPELVNKVILCGIPLDDFLSGDEKRYEVLKNFPTEKLLCLQNENDNHGAYSEVRNFVQNINPEIRIITKPRYDHDYPYYKDFVDFLG